MRCTRCDRLAIPQAVGISRDGLVVFGWCLDCLEETDCTEIEAVATRDNRRAIPRVLALGPSPVPSGATSPERRRLVLGVASLLGAWSLVLIAVGIWNLFRPVAPNPSPLGNGSPLLLLTGGFATAATSLLLLVLSHGRALLHSRQVCWWIQSGAFLLALLILLVGIIFHEPQRDPFVVAAAGLAIGLSLAAHWRERRLPIAKSSLGRVVRDRVRRH